MKLRSTHRNVFSFAAPVSISLSLTVISSAHGEPHLDAQRAIDPGQPVADTACVLPSQPTVVKREGAAVLQFWIVPETERLFSSSTPEDSAYYEFREVISGAEADVIRPVADPPEPENDDERVVWEREFMNAELAFGGSAGTIRPIQCLDALLFAYQNGRFPQATHPTEFVAAILRKGREEERTLKIYFAAGDEMFPPRGYYGLDEIAVDIDEGWEFWVSLHNHTIQKNGDLPALGVPAPSTSDVDLLQSLVRNMGLQNAWVTNGFYTIEVPASVLTSYVGRPQ